MVNDDPLVENATDEQQLAFARELAKQEELAAVGRWRAVMSSKVLREWMFRDLLPLFRLYAYIEPGDQAAVGVRNVGLVVYGRINEHPDLYLQMRNEAVKRDREVRDATRSARVKAKTTTE